MRQNIPNRDRGAAGGADAPRTSPHGMPLEGGGLPGRRGHLRPAEHVELPDTRLRYNLAGRRRDIGGIGPGSSHSLSDIRIFSASVCAPLLLVAAAILATWAGVAGGSPAHRTALVIWAIVCFVLGVGAALDVALSVWLHHRRARREQAAYPEEQRAEQR